MQAPKALKTEYPALAYYIRKDIPKLMHVPGVRNALLDLARGDPARQGLVEYCLTSDHDPIVVIGTDAPTFYEKPNRLLVRWSTAEWFETKSPHMLRARDGKVYLAGLELLLGVIDFILWDAKGSHPIPNVAGYEAFLQRVYGLSYEQVVKAHSA